MSNSDRGLFCYAMLTNGVLVSCGFPVTAAPPAGFARHLWESLTVRNLSLEARRLHGRPPLRSRPGAPERIKQCRMGVTLAVETSKELPLA